MDLVGFGTENKNEKEKQKRSGSVIALIMTSLKTWPDREVSKWMRVHDTWPKRDGERNHRHNHQVIITWVIGAKPN